MFDFFGDYTDEQLQQCSFFIEDNPVPLRINNQHDLAPYYPHIMIMGSGENGVWNCQITSHSFVDYEEEERLNWRLQDFKKYRKKCKRNKIPYIESEAIKECFYLQPTDVDKEIAHRVGLYGDKATINGLRIEIYEICRNELLNEMVRLGWDERKARYWIWKDWECLMTSGE